MRCLEGRGLNELPDAGQTLAERLGQWLDWRDAVALFDALQGVDGTPAPRGCATGARQLAALRDETAQWRSTLAQDIAADTAFHDDLSLPDARALARSRHAAWQRAMEAGIGPLRERLRVGMSAASPALARLATLDALMERALAVRERQLLSNVPVLLEPSRTTPTEASAPLPGDGSAWRGSLAAELDHRLQPIAGLLEAWADALRPAAPAANESSVHHD